MRPTIITLVMLLAALGCQNSANKAVTHTEEELAAQEQKRLEIKGIHDTAMPEMATLNRLSRTLAPLVGEDSKLAESDKSAVQSVIDKLSQAEEGMMNWMGEFQWNLDPLRDSLDHTGIMNYLATEEVKAKEVDSQIRLSMQEAQALVEKYGLSQTEEGK